MPSCVRVLRAPDHVPKIAGRSARSPRQINKIIAARLTEEDERPVNGNSSAFFAAAGFCLQLRDFVQSMIRKSMPSGLTRGGYRFSLATNAKRLRGDHAQTKR